MANAFQPNVFHAPDLNKNNPDVIALNDDDITQIKGKGDVLNNRFELLECVGSGGMSSVYKAIDRRKIEAKDRHPHVAVKVLNVEFRTHPDSLTALQREAKKCQSLAHPNIVQVYDFDRDDATVYMTMEYLSGVSLGRLMRDPYFTGIARDEALRIINDAGHALSFAHGSGIVHTDFKPANVFITNDGRVKVIDFGIARAFQHDDAIEMDATRFDPGSLQALTPTYASPQMLEHKKPNPQDDIYALACTAYEMLTGRHPFGRVPANTARDTGLKLAWNKSLTRGQYTALKHALEFDREKRTATIDQFLFEINRTSKNIGKSATALGLVALVVGVSTSYYYFSGSSKEASKDITTQDSRSTENSTVKTNFVSSAPTPDFASVKGLNTTIKQSSSSPISVSADLELKFDLTFWESIKDGRLAEYQAYLEAFPNGHFASDAKMQIAQLTQVVKTPKSRAQNISKIVAENASYDFAAFAEAPPLAAQPQPSRHVKKTKSTNREIVRLLTTADMHFNADRLLAPKFNNALFMYQKVLRLSADNPDALAGIERIKAKLLGFASDALAQNDLETARSQLKKILVIDAQDKAARAALAKLW